MLAEKALKKIEQKLSRENCVKVEFDGIGLTILTNECYPNEGSISACVYTGENYIPQSVRNSLTKSINLKFAQIETHLSLDEQNYNVYLVFEGSWSLKDGYLNQLLEEFCWIANAWRLYLDEQDRNDLVYVYVR